MPLLDAPSISRTSIEREALISTHEGHSPHGRITGPDDELQFRAFARIRAQVVFPTPRGPANKNA